MLTFEKLYSMGHEEVIFFSEPSCGLKAIIAIHDTTLGPALGGTRMWPYATEEEAIEDVLRLSRGMTYKAAVSGLNLGGGKAVIIGDPKKDKSEALFRAYGRFIESLNGRYITAEDVNISVQDIDNVYTETNYVCGVAKASGGSGNPAPYTALGTFRGMEAGATKIWGERSLKDKIVGIQGVGSVGRELAKLLNEAGARILFTDINEDNIQKIKKKVPHAEFISPEAFYSADMDVYAPCALGATVNDETIPQLKCKLINGAANNQLKEDRHGEILKEKGILYSPDYLINAGGLMNVSIEFEGWNDAKSRRMVDTIYDTTLNIYKISDEQNIPVNKAADVLAERRLDSMRKIQTTYLGRGSDHRFPGSKVRHNKL
ncbi:MAG: Glu/Leu/Phe/Val dehydrogenase dimerization domain-containing protein [Bdellovibrionota bacterium]|nr:Glu/Leu/Phe/Val dehydrogenase dimerization domain-containing protein [Bdellovibrionota bacterium]